MTNQLQQLEEITHQAVSEVFQSMVSMDVAVETPTPIVEDVVGEIVGSVGFIGEVTNGVVYLYTGVSFAKEVTGRMLGMSVEEIDNDEMVNDAIGELCNMVAGCFKRRLNDDGRPALTIPTIVRGQRLRVEGAASVARKIWGFRYRDWHFLVELLLKEPSQ